MLMKILMILGVGLLAFPISAGEPKYKPIDAETIEAYKKIGAIHGGFKTSPNHLTAFSFGKEAAENGLPGFSFNRSKDRKLTKLPASSVPFGLVLKGATDAEMPALSELKNLAAIALTDSQITEKGLKDLKNLNNLTFLDLDGCKRVRDTGLKELKDPCHSRSRWHLGDQFGITGTQRFQELDHAIIQDSVRVRRRCQIFDRSQEPQNALP